MKVQNPILPGFHPDPCALRVQGDYYVATSTFEWFPGVEIHHSTDLAHWTLVARPLDRLELLDLQGVPDSGGVWAPCLSYAEGVYYLVYAITRTVEETTQDTENYLTCARDIRGPWSPRVPLHHGGFDASMFHDADGSHWIVSMRWDSRVEKDHFAGIYLQEYCAQAQCLKGEATCIFTGSSLGLTEGPHLYQRDGTYLLMVAEGGTREDHAVLTCRSVARNGPYHPDPKGAMLTARDHPQHPIQYAGHGSLLEDGAGQWYLFHLGVRKGLFQGYSVLGRETFLQAVRFDAAGYPRLQGGGVLPAETLELPAQPTEAVADCFACAFDRAPLPLRFSWLRSPARHSLTARPGYLRLHGAQSMLSRHRQAMLGVQLPYAPISIHAHVDFHPAHFQQAAGISLFYHTANFYALLVTWDAALGRCLRLTKRDGRRTVLLAPMRPLPAEGEIALRADAAADGIRFYCDARLGWQEIGCIAAQPLTMLSDEYATQCGEQGYTGAFAALCCQDQTGGEAAADFAYFSMCPINHASSGRETICKD